MRVNASLCDFRRFKKPLVNINLRFNTILGSLRRVKMSDRRVDRTSNISNGNFDLKDLSDRVQEILLHGCFNMILQQDLTFTNV